MHPAPPESAVLKSLPVCGHGIMNPGCAGIGWRQPHYQPVLKSPLRLGFLEVHSENFFMAGGASIALLETARSLYPISLHGVGLALGGVDEIRRMHLEKLARLVNRIEPCLVSEHICWGGIQDVVMNDLLPLPYTQAALQLLTQRVQEAQEFLRRPLLLENLSQYVQYATADMSETEFLAELCRRTGCQILLDVNNLYVNAQNFSLDRTTLFSALQPAMIGEIHLAGHLQSDGCLIDNHGSRVCDPVWDWYAEALRRFGPKPTLIEWDTDIPELDVLLNEAARANHYLAQHQVAA